MPKMYLKKIFKPQVNSQHNFQNFGNVSLNVLTKCILILKKEWCALTLFILSLKSSLKTLKRTGEVNQVARFLNVKTVLLPLVNN